MGYELIVSVAVVVLVVRHARMVRASDRSKWAVGTLAAATYIVSWFLPRLTLAAFALQIAICMYVILHQTVTDESPDDLKPPNR